MNFYSAQITTAVLAVFAIVGGGCATPIGVKQVGQETAYQELAANVLSVGRPSSYSTQILERTGLSKRFRTDPETTLTLLHSGLGGPDEHDRLFALSELSFVYALEKGNTSYYLASAVYAYAFLFPDNIADAPDAYDPRLTRS